jgi:hypothetical protein
LFQRASGWIGARRTTGGHCLAGDARLIFNAGFPEHAQLVAESLQNRLPARVLIHSPTANNPRAGR